MIYIIIVLLLTLLLQKRQFNKIEYKYHLSDTAGGGDINLISTFLLIGYPEVQILWNNFTIVTYCLGKNVFVALK